MKKTFQFFFGASLSMFIITSCQRDSSGSTFTAQKENTSVAITGSAAPAQKGPAPQVCNSSAYTVILESRTQVNGNWEWIWSITNNNPGNGSNGTAQDLSNWGMQLGTCVDWTSVLGAAYSADGTNWTVFTPSYQVNPSQGCLSTPVLKFDFGTSGNAKSYYRLTVNQDYEEGYVLGYYKSGSKTSCCTVNFIGMGCGPVEIVE
jgi:hypothetical protein